MVNFTTFSGFVFLFSFTPKNGRALQPLSCMAQIKMKEKRKIGTIYKRFCRDGLATGSLEIGSFFPFFLPLGGYAISRGSPLATLAGCADGAECGAVIEGRKYRNRGPFLETISIILFPL